MTRFRSLVFLFENQYIFCHFLYIFSYIKIGGIKMYYENEKEWLKKIEEERNELDRNQKITNARLEGYEKGISDGEARGKAIGESIADVLEIKIEYVEEIIKFNS